MGEIGHICAVADQLSVRLVRDDGGGDANFTAFSLQTAAGCWRVPASCKSAADTEQQNMLMLRCTRRDRQLRNTKPYTKMFPGDYGKVRLTLCKFIFYGLDTAGKADTYRTVLRAMDLQFRILRQTGFMLPDIGHRIICFHVLKIIKLGGLSAAGRLPALNNQLIAFHRKGPF